MQNSKSGRRNISSSKPPASRSMMMLASVTTNRIGRIHAAACTQIYQTYPHQLGSLGFANQVLGQCPVHQLREPSWTLLDIGVAWLTLAPSNSTVTLLCKELPKPTRGRTVENSQVLRTVEPAVHAQSPLVLEQVKLSWLQPRSRGTQQSNDLFSGNEERSEEHTSELQ